MLLVPSLFEGFGMVLLEAALMKLPIVSADVGIARELGVTVADRTPRAFADAVQGLPGASYTIPPYIIGDQSEYFRRLRDALVSAAPAQS
jgi:hypothetical protein